ncbi:MAG: YbhB/YbcL family Raf kinase inhibitor-like protein [Candidatus Omnitrophota bacterium]
MKRLISFLTIVLVTHTVFALDIQSSVVDNKGYIPDRYTCDAQDFSPPLGFGNVPVNTVSFVLIYDDPDGPFKIWVHWVAFNIPAAVKGLSEGILKEELDRLSVVQGINDFGKVGYQGPCPPPGKAHRYSFKLYALDTMLPLKEGVSKKEVIEAMQGHIIAEARLVGLYQRSSETQVQEVE